MQRFKCPVCNKIFYESDLFRIKCSENIVGLEQSNFCPNCLKNKPPRYIKLERINTRTKFTDKDVEWLNSQLEWLNMTKEELEF